MELGTHQDSIWPQPKPGRSYETTSELSFPFPVSAVSSSYTHLGMESPRLPEFYQPSSSLPSWSWMESEPFLYPYSSSSSGYLGTQSVNKADLEAQYENGTHHTYSTETLSKYPFLQGMFSLEPEKISPRQMESGPSSNFTPADDSYLPGELFSHESLTLNTDVLFPPQIISGQAFDFTTYDAPSVSSSYSSLSTPSSAFTEIYLPSLIGPMRTQKRQSDTSRHSLPVMAPQRSVGFMEKAESYHSPRHSNQEASQPLQAHR